MEDWQKMALADLWDVLERIPDMPLKKVQYAVRSVQTLVTYVEEEDEAGTEFHRKNLCRWIKADTQKK